MVDMFVFIIIIIIIIIIVVVVVNAYVSSSKQSLRYDNTCVTFAVSTQPSK